MDGVIARFFEPDGTAPFPGVFANPRSIADYSITEDTTPLLPSDSSGSTGSATIAARAGAQAKYSGRRRVELKDKKYGTFTGTVARPTVADEQVSVVADGPFVQLAIDARLQPVDGYIGDAVRQWLIDCGIELGRIQVHPALQTDPYRRSFPGYSGDAWYGLKQLCAAFDIEIIAREGNVIIQPIRQATLAPTKVPIGETWATRSGLAGQFVEVWNYNTRVMSTPELIYPPAKMNENTQTVGRDGWRNDVEVLTVSSGEVLEFDVQLNAYLTSVEQPVCVEWVDSDYDESSVYTVMGNDNVETLDPAVWTAKGGNITVSIDEDDSSILHIRVSAGRNEYSLSPFRIAMSSGNFYSTLRIRGTGVRFQKELYRVPTGQTEDDTPNEVAITVDNPYVCTVEDTNRMIVKALIASSMVLPTLSLSAARLMPRGQGFGQVPGRRILRADGNFRARSTSITPGQVSVSGDADTTFGDFNSRWSGRTFGAYNAARGHRSFRDHTIAPLGDVPQ
jgi:hypothetical protein